MGISLNKINTAKTGFATLLKNKVQDTSLHLTSSEFRKSKKYLKRQKKQLIRDKQNTNLISFYNTYKLEGIQKGIKVFKGMPMQGIALIAEHLTQFPLSRGCRNLCSHCYVSAQTPIKKTAEAINTIDFEDFKRFNEGFKRLNKRLGFNSFDDNKNLDIAFFYDGDPVNTKMIDKKGLAHNVAEAMEIFHTNFKKPLLFDTAGWNKNDSWAQNTANDVAKFYEKAPNVFDQCNVSINPFHSIMNISNKLKTKGLNTKAKKLRDIYTERMANTLNTFMPLFNKGGSIIERFASEVPSKSDYSEQSFIKLKDEILTKLKSKSDDKNISLIEKMLKNSRDSFLVEDNPSINIGGRSTQYFSNKTQENYQQKIQKIVNDTKKTGKCDTNGAIIDINGKVFIETDENVIVPTDFQLNFINKDKKTAPFSNHINNFI